MKLIKGFNCLGPTHKMFFISTFISSVFTIYLLFDFVPEIFYGVLVSSTTLMLCYIFLTKFAAYPKKWPIGEIFLLILTFITVFHLPSHFIASSRITYRKELKDDQLIKIDNFLLGWLFKDGQLSLYLDTNQFLGPHTTFGRFINNSLQIFYFFYYIIPYVTMHFINLANCGKEIIFRYQNNGLRSPSHRRRWNNTLFLFGVYLLTCVFIFFVNTLVPASSPRKHLQDKFIHPLDLSGFAKYLNKKCKDNKSANSFPSGHVGEVLSIGLSYLGMKNNFIGIIIIIFSILIGLATLFLRYHYFCDILMAAFLSFLSFLINYYCGYKKYLNVLEKEKQTISTDISIDNNVPDSKGHVKLTEEIDNKIKNEKI
jgi:membrane-associated phospholipid phosphatase